MVGARSWNREEALQFLKVAVEMIGFMETGKANEGSLCICWLMLRVLALP